MELKLISTELNAETIQLTYTGGQPADNSKELLVVRLPFDGDVHGTIAWNQMHVIQQVSEWASQEFRRLRDEIERR